MTEGTSGGEEGETLLQSEIRPQRHRAVKIACPSFPVCSKVGNCCQWCRLRTHSARTGITHPTLCGGSHNPVYDGCTRNSSIMTPVLRRTRPAHAQQRLFWVQRVLEDACRAGGVNTCSSAARHAVRGNVFTNCSSFTCCVSAHPACVCGTGASAASKATRAGAAAFQRASPARWPTSAAENPSAAS